MIGVEKGFMQVHTKIAKPFWLNNLIVIYQECMILFQIPILI